MQPTLPPLPIICVQTVLLLCSLLQVLAVENVDFGEHVENQTGVRDSLSRKHHRVYQLYSRTSGKHVQVLGRKILAKGEDGDKFACCGGRHLWESGENPRQRDQLLPVHEPQGQAGGKESQQWECRVRLHRDNAGEQLHRLDVGTLRGLVRGLHQKGPTSARAADSPQPAGRPLHEEIPSWRAAQPAAQQFYHRKQEGQEDAGESCSS
ncbi:fibroblast growth factor 18b isoform X2 [Pygocentrus nattereri]|uniref:fibroblast growth factor 18b isoform X2 n=1 Tax=Pygocentrus nattereri TaxID=42514 RepID=UPI00081422CA|nr:fibroblast growth factor 18b isoform X2 [Pygocentrus nattereri]